MFFLPGVFIFTYNTWLGYVRLLQDTHSVTSWPVFFVEKTGTS